MVEVGVVKKHDFNKFSSDYVSGVSAAELARRAGMNPGQMHRGLKALGIAMRGISEAGRGRLMPSGESSATFKGGTVIDKDGYVRVRGAGKFRLEHRLVAERVLCRPLKRGEVVHHINEIRADNRPQNLLICTNSYHRLIHTRKNALEATGSPESRRCIYCSQYDSPSAMTMNTKGKHYHSRCATAYQRNRKEKKTP